ncbi:hypothetical protein BJ508DRAFT_314346 [Ascobolus immersus RN42]|uniref:Uncharacterized protein n=1 Tax=Ascobolus immersus RN42 TaxID=1160509 RepID=A0A3N4HFF2_ASCIM|nr:hypothetical protein BJ508DRAFT_314346 [Ascobolus immersus RN42]
MKSPVPWMPMLDTSAPYSNSFNTEAHRTAVYGQGAGKELHVESILRNGAEEQDAKEALLAPLPVVACLQLGQTYFLDPQLLSKRFNIPISTMFGFLDLPPELHYMIASHLLPQPLKDHSAQLPQCSHIYPAFERALESFSGKVVIQTYDGLAETTGVILALEIEKGSQAHVNIAIVHFIQQIYSNHLCRFLEATCLAQQQLYRSSSRISRSNTSCAAMHDMHWKVALSVVQDAFDRSTVDGTVNKAEYRFWKRFIELWTHEANRMKSSSSPPVDHLAKDGSNSNPRRLTQSRQEKICAKRLFCLRWHYEKIDSRKWHSFLFSMAPNLTTVFEQDHIDSLDEVEAVMEWLKLTAVIGRAVHIYDMPEDSKASLIGPKHLRRRGQFKNIRFGLVAALRMPAHDGSGVEPLSTQEALADTVSKGFHAFRWVPPPIRSCKEPKEHKMLCKTMFQEIMRALMECVTNNSG